LLLSLKLIYFIQEQKDSSKKVALITGITGQDGAYLAEFLLDKGYIVHGIKRRSSSFNTGRIDHLYQDPHIAGRNFILHYGDLTDSMSLVRIIQQTQPDEIYNLGKAIRWEGEGVNEKGYDSETGNLIVAVDEAYFRPTEVETLLGDPSKVKEKLGWEPKITLKEMVGEMMESDLSILRQAV